MGDKISKEGKYILTGGAALLALVFIVLYTPAANIIFGIKEAGPINVPLPLSAKASAGAPSGEALNAGPSSLRNPFTVGFAFEKAETSGAASEAQKKPAGFLVLQGIFELPEGSSAAIIDDRMVMEGQTIYNWTVQSISSDRVALVKGGNTKILRLKLGVE